MATIGLGVYLYKVIDGIADVYEGRLQQADKLYLAGMSQTLRSVGVIAVFSVVLFLTRSMPIASMAMGVTAIASLVLVTAPLALLETEKIAPREPARGRSPVYPVHPAFWRTVPVQPYREHAQVRDGRHAGLQISAVL